MRDTNRPPEPESPDSESLADLLTPSTNRAEPYEMIEDVVQKPKRKQKRRFYFSNIRLYAVVAAIATLTTIIVAAVILVAVAPQYVVVTPTFSYPTNVPQYSRDNWNWDVPLMTNSAIGEIPVGVKVYLKDMAFDSNTLDWRYTVQDDSGHQADAMPWQLMPVPPPTPTPFPYAQDIGMGALFITTEPVGDMPANTRVSISQATIDQQGWLYTIVSEDEKLTAGVRAWQITYAPGVTPGMTPTSPFNSLLASGQYAVITKVQIGEIPPNTRVNIGSGHFNGREWAYSIVSEDGHYADNALQSQLAPAPGAPPLPTPAPTDTPTPLAALPPTNTPSPTPVS